MRVVPSRMEYCAETVIVFAPLSSSTVPENCGTPQPLTSTAVETGVSAYCCSASRLCWIVKEYPRTAEVEPLTMEV